MTAKAKGRTQMGAGDVKVAHAHARCLCGTRNVRAQQSVRRASVVIPPGTQCQN